MSQDQDTAAPAAAPSRRAVLGGALGAAAAATGLTAPAVHAQGPATLRFLGTAVNQHQGIKDKVREDLGMNLEYVAVTSDDVVRRAVTQPNSFDVVDLEVWMARRVLPTGNLQGMDAKRIQLVGEITPVMTRGEIGGKKLAAGASHRGRCCTWRAASPAPSPAARPSG